MKEEDKKKTWHGFAALLQVPISGELNYDDVFAVTDALRKYYKDEWKKDAEEVLNGLNEISEKTSRITTGDLPHNAAYIKGVTDRLIDKIKEKKELFFGKL